MAQKTQKTEKRRLARVKDAYEYTLTIPDRFYPFRKQVSGTWVRGRRAYDEAVAEYRKKLDATTGIGYRLGAYRQVFHLAGSLLAIIISTLISRELFGSDIALFTLLAFLVLFITYQEFRLHPREYHQHWQKGIADWFVWLTPVGVYLFEIFK